jgi:DNA-binding NarL/FixJ family response regulator
MGMADVFALIVEDDELFARRIVDLLANHWGLRGVVASSCLQGRAIVASGMPFAAAIVDIQLGDGCGMELVETEIRPARPHTPVLISTGFVRPDVVNRAYRAGAKILCKPWCSVDLALFVDEARRHACFDERLRDSLARVTSKYHLATGERRVLELKLEHAGLDEMADHMQVAETSVRTYRRNLLAKTGDGDLDTLARRVVLEARRTAEPSRASDVPGG